VIGLNPVKNLRTTSIRHLAFALLCGVSLSIGLVSPAEATILWTDDIQTGSSPWGFHGLWTEHPIGTAVENSDANGASLTVVGDPVGGGGKAMRHYGTAGTSSWRAQAGIWTGDNKAFASQIAAHNEVWVEMEIYIPEAVVSSGKYPFLNILDFHSTNSDGGFRFHTNPGLFLCSSAFGRCGGGNMKLVVRDFFGNQTGPSAAAVPIAQWFKLQVHWVWSLTGAPITYWINGVQVLQTSGTVTKRPSHTLVEFYDKWYGSGDGGSWSPNPLIKYSRNVRFADAYITSSAATLSLPIRLTGFDTLNGLAPTPIPKVEADGISRLIDGSVGNRGLGAGGDWDRLPTRMTQAQVKDGQSFASGLKTGIPLSSRSTH
jgi:hypothetical protein